MSNQPDIFDDEELDHLLTQPSKRDLAKDEIAAVDAAIKTLPDVSKTAVDYPSICPAKDAGPDELIGMVAVQAKKAIQIMKGRFQRLQTYVDVTDLANATLRRIDDMWDKMDAEQQDMALKVSQQWKDVCRVFHAREPDVDDPIITGITVKFGTLVDIAEFTKWQASKAKSKMRASAKAKKAQEKAAAKALKKEEQKDPKRKPKDSNRAQEAHRLRGPRE